MLETRLDMIINGYSDDQIGVLAYVLNHRFNLSESKLREIFEVEVGEIHSKLGSQAIERVVKMLITKFRTKPEVNEIIDVLYGVFDALDASDLATPERMTKLSNYIYGNWDELLAEIPSESELEPEPEQEGGKEFERRLAGVRYVPHRAPRAQLHFKQPFTAGKYQNWSK
jgi:hypothetical protein